MGDQPFQWENGGDLGEHFWPFDPGPPGPLHSAASWGSPVERPPLHAHLMNASMLCPRQVAVCHSHSAHTQYMHSKQFRLPNGRSMTQVSCITLVVCRHRLRPLRSWTRLPGFSRSQLSNSLPGWCRSPFQAVAFQSTFQKQDSMMVELGRTLWGSWADLRTIRAVWHPREMASCKNLDSHWCLEHLKLERAPDAEMPRARTLRVAIQYPLAPS